MRWQYYILISWALLLSFSLKSQDVHFTDYRFAPLQLNPAKTGAFYGSYRISGMYRDQFDSFIDKGYTTKLINFDSPLDFGLAENHWVGWGINFYSDIAGDIGLQTTGIALSGAYHFAFDDKYKNVLTLGVQYGRVARKFKETNNAIYADALLDQLVNGGNIGTTMDPITVDQLDENQSDLNIGLLYRAKLSDIASLELGGSVHHLLDQKKNSGGQGINQIGNQIQRRINAHGAVRYQSGKNFILEPGFALSSSQNYLNLAIQLNADYLLRNLDGMILHFGAGHRLGDALQWLIGATYRKWRVGLSYDMTVSSASAYNNSIGGFEIGVQRVFNFYKKPEPDPTIFCPRF